MPKENNKMQVDIDTLFKQNVNDLLSIKELYRKLKEMEEKISQIKYIDSVLAKKLKNEYEKLKKIILDENVQVKLNNDIETINSQLVTINSQLDTKTKGFINLAECGAKCDGITDDTQAFILAHEKLPQNGGKIIIPSGKIIISQKIVFNKTVILEGCAMDFSGQSNSMGSLIWTIENGELEFRGNSSCVKDFMISSDSYTSNSGNGISMLCPRPSIHNVSVYNQNGYGIKIGSETEDINVNSWYASNVKVRGNGHGLYVGHPTGKNASAGCCTKIDASYNNGNGIVLNAANTNNFLSTHIELNKQEGIKFIKSSSNFFLNPYLENNNGETIKDIVGDNSSIQNYVFGTMKVIGITHIYFENDNNLVMGYYPKKGEFPFFNKIVSDRLRISGKDITGNWNFEQLENGDLQIGKDGTSSSGVVKIRHKGSGKASFDVNKLSFNDSADGITSLTITGGTRNFGTIQANSTGEQTYNLTGASVGDLVLLRYYFTPPNGVTFMGYVSEDNKVVVRCSNVTNENISVNGNVGCVVIKIGR